ncbi:hypothetical protein BOTCAL_0326g00140 [Botryotinia calthae]|uniref:DUF6594 domain-containing protein n=1 Tax=Botryotinia calthae TaxID=38488 RepID=A0A4Y8CW45_9HELO|nr:hypothetical protein BOTCAL_0326g00140 [Botryotinia calthae]
MSTPPPCEIDENMKEEIHELIAQIRFDPNSLLPVRPDGITDEQCRQGCPDEKTEHYLKYLRGIKVELHPKGYPQLAAVIASDERFMLYRRFGFLQARLLLNKKDQMRALESQLEHIDQYYGRKDPRRLCSQEACNVLDDEYRKLLAEIEKKYNEYVQLLTHAKTLASFDSPKTTDYLRLKGYFDRKAPVCNKDQRFILQKENPITLKPTRDNSWLHTVIEQIPQRFPGRLTLCIFCTTHQLLFWLHYIPICILWYLCQTSTPSSANNGISVAVLLVFTSIFSTVISLFTCAKRHQVLAAAAAYFAVLVLFIGNVETVGEMFLAG